MAEERLDDREMMTEDSPKVAAAFTSIAIVGLGLIGASLAAALRKAYPEAHILGVDVNSRTNVTAKDLGWVNEAVRPNDPIFEDFIRNQCDLVVVATPVAAVKDYFASLAEWDYKNVITDTISTKASVVEAANELLPYPNRYIPGHPMAGSEKNGIDGAREDLFCGINWILCPDADTVPEDFQHLHELITGMDARVVSLPREDHDRAIAIVSHVPHMLAASLMELASRHTDDTQSLMRLAAGGFKDTTRVAAGSPQLWTGIAFDNAAALQEGLEEVVQIIGAFTDALQTNDRIAFTEVLTDAADARRSLPAAWVPSTDKLLEVRIPMINRNGVVAEVTTIASSVGCNIQSIEIDHISEGNAVLSLVLTDEGDIGKLSLELIQAGFSVSFRPLTAEEHVHVDY